MKLTARIAFKLNEKPKTFQLVPAGDNKPWRFLAESCAVELAPVCDREAQTVSKPPTGCDRLEIWAVQWGYPDSLVSAHAHEVERMRQAHLAGKHGLEDGNYTWKHWLEHYGKAELWHLFRTPEMERVWLNWRNGPGGTLSTFAGLSGRIKREEVELIRFRADFNHGEKCQTVFLSECFCTPLTQQEITSQPEHFARQEKLLEKQAAFETTKAANRKEEERAKRQRDLQPVTKQEVKTALKVKSDRGALEIFKRHKFDDWPQTQKELDVLVTKHKRRKRACAEAQGKRMKNRAATR